MARLLLGLSVLCLILAAISLTVGPAQISISESLTALIYDDEGPLTMVMREIRLPRTILAFIVGSGLGLAGAAMQGYLRNPLAEPGLIGVSASAALGAVIAIQTGISVSYAFGLPLMALLGAVIGVFLVMLLAGSRGNSITLILAGIAISALAAAFTSLALNLSPNPYAANEIIFWMMGSLADRSMTHVGISLPFVVIGTIMLFTIAKGLDALTLGEDAASALGTIKDVKTHLHDSTIVHSDYALFLESIGREDEARRNYKKCLVDMYGEQCTWSAVADGLHKDNLPRIHPVV